MLQFARATVFAPVIEHAPPIPFQKFYFVEYDQLQHRIQSTEILTGKINYFFQKIKKKQIHNQCTN